jgi:hypothetical protein
MIGNGHPAFSLRTSAAILFLAMLGNPLLEIVPIVLKRHLRSPTIGGNDISSAVVPAAARFP